MLREQCRYLGFYLSMMALQPGFWLERVNLCSRLFIIAAYWLQLHQRFYLIQNNNHDQNCLPYHLAIQSSLRLYFQTENSAWNFICLLSCI